MSSLLIVSDWQHERVILVLLVVYGRSELCWTFSECWCFFLLKKVNRGRLSYLLFLLLLLFPLNEDRKQVDLNLNELARALDALGENR